MKSNRSFSLDIEEARRRLEVWRKSRSAWKTDTRSAVGFGGGVGPHSWSQPRLAEVGPGLQRTQTAGGGNQDATTVAA